MVPGFSVSLYVVSRTTGSQPIGLLIKFIRWTLGPHILVLEWNVVPG
jgi:hypothetical protein